MAQVFELFSTGGRIMQPITSDNLAIGQRVRQAHTGKDGVICSEFNGHGYLVIFNDGSASDGQRLESLSPYTRISALDGIVDQNEIERLKALHIEKINRDKAEAEIAAQQLKKDEQTQIAKLKALYPWAASPEGISSYARASKNLRKELSIAFPGVKFSVRSESFAGGNSVNVEWTDGPTRKQVEEIANKYQYGSFNGMEDIYNYDNSAFSHAVGVVLGQSKYVSCQRKYSEGLRESIGQALCDLQNIAYDGLRTAHLFGNGDDDDLIDHVYKILSHTNIPVGGKLAGAEHNLADNRVFGHWAILKFESPAITAPTPAPTTPEPAPPCPLCKNALAVSDSVYSCDCGFKATVKAKNHTVTINEEKQGIEIRFKERPSEFVLTSLKSAGWRWSKFNKCWYAKNSDKAIHFANSL